MNLINWSKKRNRHTIGIFLFICGLGFMLYGIFQGEYAIVLKKATTICLECIGIG